MDNNEEKCFNNLKDALTCGICQEIATLPVHPLCCENSKSMAPGCLSCVRKYYELNIPINRRSTNTKKSWNGCGCDINITYKYSTNYYHHTTQLDMIRNLLGPSVCPNEGCNISCTTTAELRRHLNGSINPNDKFGACAKAFTKCNYCGFYGKREFVEGNHYNEKHAFIKCDVCLTNILKKDALVHYYNHKFMLNKFKLNLEDQKIKNKK